MKANLIVILLILISSCASLPASPESSPIVPSNSPEPSRTPPAAQGYPPPAITTADKLPSPIPTEASTPAPSWPTQTPLPTLQPGSPLALTGFDMVDELNGWGFVEDGRLLRTSDGGHTWKDASPPVPGFYFTGDRTHAWSANRGQVLCKATGCTSHWMPGVITWTTEDGGESWIQQGSFPGGIPELRPVDMEFIDHTYGWFLFVDQAGMSGFTYQSLVRTDDSGKSWSSAVPPQSGCSSGGMVFLDGQNGWTGDDCRWIFNSYEGIPLEEFTSGKTTPTLYRTTDGGETWNTFMLPPMVMIPGEAASLAENTPIYCGTDGMEKITSTAFILQWRCSLGLPDRAPSISYAYLTGNDGATWHTWLSTGNEHFLNPQTGWRLNNGDEDQPGQLQKTTDGGVTWDTIKTVGWKTADLDFTNEDSGWAIVSDGTNSAFVFTHDGGLQWTEIKPVIGQ